MSASPVNLPMMVRLRFWVNNKVIQLPLLADWVYRLSFHGNWISNLLRDQVAKFFPVKISELASVQSSQGRSSVIVGTTNICNAKCSFCAYPRAVEGGTLRTGVMTMPTFQKIISEWVKNGGTSMDFTPVVGDPLIDPGLIEKIKFARAAGLTGITFTTNGILLNHQDNYKKLVDEKVTGLYFSIGATDEEQYKLIYGVNQYPKVISGLRNLLEYNRQHGDPVYINIRFRNAQNPSEILKSEDFVKYIKPYISPKLEVNFTVDFDNWGGTIRQEELPGIMRLRKARPEMKIPCTSLYSYAIRHDGSVRLCGCRMKSSDLDDLVVGNINQLSLEQISNSTKTKDIIEGFYQGRRPDTCKSCTLYTPLTRSWLKERRDAIENVRSKITSEKVASQ